MVTNIRLNALCEWLILTGFTVAGTTDRACEVTANPAAVEEDIQFILNEISNYLSSDVSGKLSKWYSFRLFKQNV